MLGKSCEWKRELWRMGKVKGNYGERAFWEEGCSTVGPSQLYGGKCSFWEDGRFIAGPSQLCGDCLYVLKEWVRLDRALGRRFSLVLNQSSFCHFVFLLRSVKCVRKEGCY
ncbi:unnamed protein product [Rhizophagus irregularis]|nr:unnamed protein product [Rhizophagus irregularis]